MAADYSKEAIRTNCSQVQQSRRGTAVYEPDHLWVPYVQGQNTDCLQPSRPPSKELGSCWENVLKKQVKNAS